MTKFLHDASLSEAIREICRKHDSRCAVAFWGDGTRELFDEIPEIDAPKIILNLATGSTNPSTVRRFIEDFGEENIKQIDTLHAKVYIGSGKAIVCSANASSNGLGLEGGEQGFWREAGIIVKDKFSVDKITEWFDGLWKVAKEITGADLNAADERWKLRREQSRGHLLCRSDAWDAHPVPLGSHGNIVEAVEMARKKAISLGGNAKFIDFVNTKFKTNNHYIEHKNYYHPYNGQKFTTKPILRYANELTIAEYRKMYRTGGIGHGGAARILGDLGFEIRDNDGNVVYEEGERNPRLR